MAKVINRVLGGSGSGFYPSAFFYSDNFTSAGSVTLVGQDKSYNGVWTDRYVSPLPSGFQEVEYIQSSGTQYIDTGVSSNSNINADITFSEPSGSGSQTILGGGDNWQSNYLQYSEANADTIWGAFGNYVDDASFTFTSVVNIKNNANKFYANGTLLLTLNNSTWSSSYTINIFTYNRGGSHGEYFIGKCYSCKIYNGNTLVRNFVPAIRTSDNKPCLYDLVTNTPYYNQGTGDDFTYGEEIHDYGFNFPKIDKLGTYTYTATQGSLTKTGIMLIDVATHYDIEISYVPTSGLVAEWLFEDWNDSSGNSYNLTNSGCSLTSSGLSGLPYCMSKPSGSYNAHASAGVLPAGSSATFTISFWVKATTWDSENFIINTRSTGTGYNFEYSSVYFFKANAGSGDVYVQSSQAMSTGTWYHCIATRNGTAATLYVNGVLVGSGTTASVTSNSMNLYLGHETGYYGRSFVGCLAGVRIYNRVLTADEISVLYNNGNGQ